MAVINVDSRKEKIELSSVQDVYDVNLLNPFKFISDRGYIFRKKDSKNHIDTSRKTRKKEVFDNAESLRILDSKLCKELAEHYIDQNIEELTDLLEVSYATAITRSCTMEQLEQAPWAKGLKRGAFQDRILPLEELIVKIGYCKVHPWCRFYYLRYASLYCILFILYDSFVPRLQLFANRYIIL